MGQSGSGSDGNKGVLLIPYSFSITGASASDCLLSDPGHLLEESYPSVEISQCILRPQPTRPWLNRSNYVKFTECIMCMENYALVNHYKWANMDLSLKARVERLCRKYKRTDSPVKKDFRPQQ